MAAVVYSCLTTKRAAVGALERAPTMVSYTPLLTHPPEGPDYSDGSNDVWGSSVPKSEDQPSPLSRRVASTTVRAVWFVLLACLVSIVASVVNLTWSPPRIPPPPPLRLTYPNTYIGLEKAVLNDTIPAQPIINFPLVLAQINSSEPLAEELQRNRLVSASGKIYAQEREFLVTHEVFTIAQFRSIDFGMERCVAKLEIPSLADVENLPHKKVSISNEPCTLQIWSLDTAGDTQPRTFSWASRPRRIDLLTTMVVGPRPNLMSSPFFPCPSLTSLAFEISSSTAGCHLHFQQDTKSPRLAFYITQHPTAQ
ncbi:hypothetical protein C8R44DRAFT_320071 [Mycena epipterygia]|nr:hypothetical protein C8R44DRAFT_320071 [Mycena epipterygia]